MKTSQQWIDYFTINLQEKRISWKQSPGLNATELTTILKSLQAWQLGETSDGSHLISASKKYAEKTGDLLFVDAVKLFIQEEQKHGNNLGKYLDIIGEPRVQKNWGDALFRKIRYFNTSMEIWTLAVITVESAAQVFYQALKDATKCNLLQQICVDILIDESAHIKFQQERLMIIFNSKSALGKRVSFYCFKYFYFTTTLVVWFAHKKVFKAGNNTFKRYFLKMHIKFEKTIGRLRNEPVESFVLQYAE